MYRIFYKITNNNLVTAWFIGYELWIISYKLEGAGVWIRMLEAGRPKSEVNPLNPEKHTACMASSIQPRLSSRGLRSD